MQYSEPPRFAPQAVTSPPMLNALNMLEDRLHRLTEILTELEGRLAPILSPSLDKSPTVAPDKSISASASSYTQRLIAAHAAVECLNSRLAQLLQLVEC